MQTPVIPIVLAGGKGTRLWPLSTHYTPKQFLSPLEEDDTLFQETLKRLSAATFLSFPYIISETRYEAILHQQAKEAGLHLDAYHLILETHAKGTATAILAASLHLEKTFHDAWLLIMPSDHYLESPDELFDAAQHAACKKNDDKIICFGTYALLPQPGYGYIVTEQPFDHDSLQPIAVKTFLEKPSAEAIQALDTKHTHWNTGIYMARLSTLLSSFRAYQAYVLLRYEALYHRAVQKEQVLYFNTDQCSDIEPLSIDHAIIEKATNLAMIFLSQKWTDLGSWKEVWKYGEKVDPHSNVLKGNIVAKDVSNSLLYSSRAMLTAIGVTDIICVATKSGILLANKHNLESLKPMLENILKEGRTLSADGDYEHRPWGYYEVLESSEHRLIKRIVINPGEALSLQQHRYRSEQWFVTKGALKVIRGEDRLLLHTHDSIFIPQGMRHSMENVGSEEAEIIEIQLGEYLGEEDIERISDPYERETAYA